VLDDVEDDEDELDDEPAAGADGVEELVEPDELSDEDEPDAGTLEVEPLRLSVR
jgi:hypothetical protein